MYLNELLVNYKNLSLSFNGKVYTKTSNLFLIKSLFNKIFKLYPNKDLENLFKSAFEKCLFDEKLMLLWSLITNDIEPLKTFYKYDEQILNDWLKKYSKTLDALASYKFFVKDEILINALFGDYSSCEVILKEYSDLKKTEKLIMPKRPIDELPDWVLYIDYRKWLVKMLDYRIRNDNYYLFYPWKVYKS